MIMTNDREPMIFYSRLTVSTTLSVFVEEILTTWTFQGQSVSASSVGCEATLIGEFDFHGVLYLVARGIITVWSRQHEVQLNYREHNTWTENAYHIDISPSVHIVRLQLL